jgi:tetratricopeptide (TPR) repeat protein
VAESDRGSKAPRTGRAVPERRGRPDGGASGGRPRQGVSPRRGNRTAGGTAGVRPDGPPIPDDVSANELAKTVRQQLRSLPDKLAARVARHLVAAGRLLDSDPETAYQHTLAARARAARLSVVREACAEAAYAAGHYPEALTEFRAVHRMTGDPAFLPVIADCERGLGRPERALKIAQDPAVNQLDATNRVEMMIVAAGARIDLGQVEAAALYLEPHAKRSRSLTLPTTRLRYAYADALLAAGRAGDALEWFHRAAASDREGLTDAAVRAAELEGIELVSTAEESDDGDHEPDDDMHDAHAERANGE